MGDYPSGDPGFFSFIRKAAGFAAGFIPGAGGVAGRVVSGGGATKVINATIAERAVSRGGAIIRRGGAIIAKHPVLSAAAGAATVGALGGAVAEREMMAGAACPKGHHISKSKHSKHFGQCVKNRHMRVTNPRALRRALRRAHGFARLAMKTIHLVHPKKKARFGGFKKRRK